MTLEEYIDKYLVETNQLLKLLGQTPITANRLRAKGVKVVKCQCQGNRCDGWSLAKGEVQH